MPKPQKHVFVCVRNRPLGHPRPSCGQKNCAEVAEEFGGLKVFIDRYSAPLLKGVTVDFLDGMDGSGFKFENSNANASCGCGNSFSA